MNIYFAHSIRDYGTQKSRDAMVAIRERWPGAKVYNPEGMQKDFRQVTAEIYEKILRRCLGDGEGLVAVLEHQDSIGRGVFTEVNLALRWGFPVFVLRDGEFVEVSSTCGENRRDWSVHYSSLVLKGGPDANT